MTKLAIIPFTVVLETIFLNKKFRSFPKSLPHSAQCLILSCSLFRVVGKKNDFSYSTSLNLSVRPSRPPSWSCSWESASHRSRISSSISSAPSSPCSPSLRHASGRLYPCDCCSAAQASCWILQSFMHPAYTASTCWLVILNLVLNKADQPNPEEAEGFLDAAVVPVVAVLVRGAARH